MQARYYDPVIGRFLSNDPVGFAQGGWQYFNRYSYTANDPVNFWDPSGNAFSPAVNVQGLSPQQEQQVLSAISAADAAYSNSSNPEFKAAWDAVATVNIGPSMATNASNVVVQGQATFDISARRSQAGDWTPFSDGNIDISSEYVLDSNGNFNAAEFHSIFSHEVGHGTVTSLQAGFAKDLAIDPIVSDVLGALFENSAEHMGRAAAIEGGLLSASSNLRIYSSEGNFTEINLQQLGN